MSGSKPRKKFVTKIGPREQHPFEAYMTMQSYRDRMEYYRGNCFRLTELQKMVIWREIQRVDKWLTKNRKFIKIYFTQAS